MNWWENFPPPPAGPAIPVWDGEHGHWVQPSAEGQVPAAAANNQFEFINPAALCAMAVPPPGLTGDGKSLKKK